MTNYAEGSSHAECQMSRLVYIQYNPPPRLLFHSSQLHMLTHQPLNTHQSPVPDFGVIMGDQFDQSRFTVQIGNGLLCLVSTVGDEFTDIVSGNREDYWISRRLDKLDEASAILAS